MLLLTIIQAVLFAAPEVGSGVRAASVTDGVGQLTEQLYACRMPDGSDFGDAIKTSATDLRLRELVRVCHRAKAGVGDDAGWALVELSVSDVVASLNNTQTDKVLRAALTPLDEIKLLAVGIGEGTKPARPGWESVTSNGIAMAIETAQDDALRQVLAAHAGGSKLSAERADALTKQVMSVSPKLHASQVCTVTVPFELEGVKYEAIGYGVPPWSQVHTWRSAERPPALNWAVQTLVATGRGATTGGVASERERAVACSTAKANALITIASRVDELPIPDPTQTIMGSFIRATPRYDAAWSAFLRTARTTNTDFANGVCAVEMTLDLNGLWRLFTAIEHLETDASQLKNPDVR